MAKWSGRIGFADEIETSPGIWEVVVTEKMYVGELIKNSRRFQGGDKVNSDLNISNDISILADAYASSNFHSMKYVTFMGSKWHINNLSFDYPRITLSIGGLYNV